MGYELKPRSSFWLTRLLNLFGAKNTWTTFGNTTYYPDGLNPAQFPEVVAHEKIHVEQYHKLTVPFFLFLYCLVPLPVFFAYFRWRFEREGYLVEAKMYLAEGKMAKELLIEKMVQVLWTQYTFPWPKFMMRKWFKKQLGG